MSYLGMNEELALRKQWMDLEQGYRLEREIAAIRAGVVESTPGTRNGVDVSKSAAEPDLVKVGPKGYIHGWIHVGSNDDDIPVHGYAVQTLKEKRGVARVNTVHHVFHDGKHIGAITESPSKKSFSAQPEMGEPKRFKSVKKALAHVAAKSGIPLPSETRSGVGVEQGSYGNNVHVHEHTPSTSTGKFSVTRNGSSYLTTNDPAEAHAAAKLLEQGNHGIDVSTPRKMREALNNSK